MPCSAPSWRYDYDLLGREIGSHSMEAGERWTLIDIAGKVRYGWDSREHRRRTTYDALGRPADVHLKTGGESERLVGRTEYGEIHPDSAAHNLRGQPYRTSTAPAS
jgi:hypothetical protein